MTVLVVAVAAVGGYAIFGRGKKKAHKPVPVAATTTTTRFMVVAVAPDAGPVGTTFNLVGVGFTPGDDVTFFVDFPNGSSFTGLPHVVAQNTTVIATYKATPGNPIGDYTVRARSTRNENVQGKFTVLGPGGTTASSAPPGAATSSTSTTSTTPTRRPATTSTTSTTIRR